jgi:hypothetical protein
MTVGQELAQKTGFPLYHNHLSIESVRPVFGFGEASFHRLVDGQRTAMFEEVANSGLPGLIFTYMWAFDLPSEDEIVDKYAEPFRQRSWRVCFVELRTPLDVRLERDVHPARLEAKPSKRLLTEERRLELQSMHVYESGTSRLGRSDWLIIENGTLSPAAVAEQICGHFSLGAPRE